MELSLRFISSKGIPVLMILFISITLIMLPSVTEGNYIQATQTSKFIFFCYSLVVLAVLFSVRLFSINSFSITRIDLALLILVIYIVINRYFIQPYYGFSIKYYELIGLVVFYLLVRNSAQKYLQWLLIAVIISGLYQAIYGLLQLWGYYPSYHSGFKMTGSFFNPGPYAGFLSAVFPLALGVYIYRSYFAQEYVNRFQLFGRSIDKSKVNGFINMLIWEYIPLAAILSILIVLPASRSRAAWLACVVSSLVILAIRYDFMQTTLDILNRVWKRILALSVVLTLVVGAILFVYYFKKESADGRLLIWKNTLTMFNNNVLFGVGYDRFKAHYMDYQGAYFREVGETEESMVAGDNYYAFNEFLLFLAEEGVIGLVFLGGVLVVVLKNIRLSGKYANRYYSRILAMVLLAIFLFGSFSYPGEILPIKIILVFCLAVLGSNSDVYSLKWNNVIKYSTCLIGGVSVAYCGISVREIEQNLTAWSKAVNTYSYGAYASSVEDYEAVYSMFNDHGEYLMNYGKALVMAEEYEKGILVLERAGQYFASTIIQTALGDAYNASGKYEEAEKAYWKAWYMIPSRFYPKYLLAMMYQEQGEREKANVIAQELMSKKVKIDSPAIKEIRSAMRGILKANQQ